MNVVALRRVVLLLSALGFLCVKAEIPIQPKFDLKKFAGQWYPISAVANKGHPINYAAGAPVFEFKTKNTLTWSMDSPVEETKCKKKTVSLTQFEKPGKYKMEGHYVVCIVETDYSSYAIHHREKPENQLLSLYARTKEVSKTVKDKFKSVARSLGFPPYKIYPIRLEECEEPKKYIS